MQEIAGSSPAGGTTGAQALSGIVDCANAREDLGSKAFVRLLEVPMNRVVLPLLVSLAVLAAAPFAQASDASLKKALKPYETRLTTDIGYLSNFSAPSKSAAPAALTKLSKIRSDLTGATKAATGQQASTSSGRKGRTQVLSALHDATVAAGDAQACATAARFGNKSTAKRDAKAEQGEINKAIPLFESGGKLLHLFS
jgi:hypothetical protein